MRTLAGGGTRPAAAARLRGRGNLAAAVVDQGLSSLTNLGLNLAVASTSSTETFGALGLVVALYLLEVGVVYGAIVEPYSVTAPDERDRATPHAVAAALVLGLVLGAAHLLAGTFTSGDLGAFLTVYAVATPGLVVQAATRGLLIGRGQASIALRSNLLWAVVQLVLSVMALRSDSGLGLLVAWSAGAWVAAAYCTWHLGVGIGVRGWRTWFHGRGRMALSWTGDQLAQGGLSQVMVFTLGAVAGLAAVGSYRGALQLTGPVTVLVSGLRVVVLPGAARRARARDGSLRRAITRLTVGFPVMTFVLVAPLLLLPDAAGEWLLGETWSGARAVLPWLLVMRMASSATAALSVGMRATQDYRDTLYLRIGGGVSMIVAATAAGAVDGAMGASIAMAVVALAWLPLWQLSFNRRAG